jgi:hypothetical protein
VPLDALSCVVQEFFRSIATLFCNAPQYSDAIPDCAGDRTRCPGRLLSRFGNMFGRSVHYCLRHCLLPVFFCGLVDLPSLESDSIVEEMLSSCNVLKKAEPSESPA